MIFPKRTFLQRFSNKRWRSATFSGGYKITLQGIGSDGIYNGELKCIPIWWFQLWYIETEHVPTEQFTKNRRLP